MEAGPWLEPGSLRHPATAACAADRALGVTPADAAASLPPSPLPARNSEPPPDRLDLTPPSSARCQDTALDCSASWCDEHMYNCSTHAAGSRG